MKTEYSITELKQLGYSEEMLRRITRLENQKVCYRTSPKGKWIFKKDKLDSFLERLV